MLATIRLLLLAFNVTATPLREGDLDKLQGLWTIETFERDGEPPRHACDLVPVSFRDGLMIIESSPGQNFKLDLTRDPKWIDLVTEKGVALAGIYSVKGDTLLLCIQRMPGRARPLEFRTTEGSGAELWKLRRLNRP